MAIAVKEYYLWNFDVRFELKSCLVFACVSHFAANPQQAAYLQVL